MDAFDRQAHKIFVEALKLDESEWAELVRRECGDNQQLRVRVDGLLAAVRSADDFLESPALTTLGLRRPSTSERHREFDQDAIPGFTILQRLGVGGMAEVYEAEQRSPQRRVAIKILHRVLVGTSALQRFEFEANTLAKLNHPSIAQIYGTGTCADSQGNRVPFFVMEFIPGAKTIARYAKEASLDRRELLGIFAEVVDAVQIGHQAGVIHRDLKPGNILVDEDGHPKVIDFGVAKAVTPEFDDITAEYERSNIIGTLNYMSPEQCGGERRVDTRSDIYSLGVVLYELVTGRRPYDLTSSSIVEAVQVVRHESPTRPNQLEPTIPKSLNAIILKSLEKDPESRYATASELAADLRRFRDHRPVMARPPSFSYQLRMFAKRNPGLSAAIACSIIALVGGIAATTRMAYVAAAAREKAEANSKVLEQVVAFQESQLMSIDPAEMGDQLRTKLADSVQAALANQPESDETQVESAVTAFTETLNNANFTTLARNALQSNLLEKSIASIRNDYADQPVVRARLLEAWAATMRKLGKESEAIPAMKEARDIFASTLGDDHELSMRTAGRYAMLILHERKYDEAIQLLDKLLARRRRVSGVDAEQTLNVETTLGSAYESSGQPDKARRAWEHALEHQRRVLGDDHEQTLMTLGNLGVVAATQGDYALAEKCWREQLQHRGGEASTRSAKVQGNLGILMLAQGKPQEGLALFSESLATYRALLGDDHPTTLWMISNVADAKVGVDDPEGAQQLFEECLAGRRTSLGPAHPHTLRSMVKLGEFYLKTDRPELARELVHDALVIQREVLGEDHPDTIVCISMLGRIQLANGRAEESEQLQQEAIERAHRVLGNDHLITLSCLANRGELLVETDAHDAAETLLVDLYERTRAVVGASGVEATHVADLLVRLYKKLGTEDAAAKLEKWKAVSTVAGEAADQPN